MQQVTYRYNIGVYYIECDSMFQFVQQNNDSNRVICILDRA